MIGLVSSLHISRSLRALPSYMFTFLLLKTTYTKNTYTALHLAAASEAVSSVTALLANGANASATNSCGLTPGACFLRAPAPLSSGSVAPASSPASANQQVVFLFQGWYPYAPSTSRALPSFCRLLRRACFGTSSPHVGHQTLSFSGQGMAANLAPIVETNLSSTNAWIVPPHLVSCRFLCGRIAVFPHDVLQAIFLLGS